MNAMGRGKSMGSGKNGLVLVDDRLEVRMHTWCLNSLNGMELVNNSQMTFFDDIFNSTRIDDIRGSYCDSMEIILLSLLLELHG